MVWYGLKMDLKYRIEVSKRNDQFSGFIPSLLNVEPYYVANGQWLMIRSYQSLDDNQMHVVSISVWWRCLSLQFSWCGGLRCSQLTPRWRSDQSKRVLVVKPPCFAIFDHHFWQKAPLLKSFNQFWLSNHHRSPCLIARPPFLMVKQLIRHFQVRTWWLSRCLKLKPAIQSRESCMTLWLHIQHCRCPRFSSSFLRSFLRRD